MWDSNKIEKYGHFLKQSGKEEVDLLKYESYFWFKIITNFFLIEKNYLSSKIVGLESTLGPKNKLVSLCSKLHAPYVRNKGWQSDQVWAGGSG